MADRASFDDYKLRLNGDPDLWQLRGAWWHVTETRKPDLLRERPVRQPVRMTDLAGGSCVVAPWMLHE